MHILAKSYTAGHCRAFDDQVNMAPKAETAPETRKLHGSHEDLSLKKYI